MGTDGSLTGRTLDDPGRKPQTNAAAMKVNAQVLDTKAAWCSRMRWI
ncbi:hypothetical protein EC2780750_0485 [Escherichia coli 2780750]|nr:hypothetical protein EC2780750_0485 [Escherichia coli 2780750]